MRQQQQQQQQQQNNNGRTNNNNVPAPSNLLDVTRSSSSAEADNHGQKQRLEEVSQK
jgi:hypothetical protein